ncbi:MAG: hypothetical protein M3M99_07250 [Actinomycetota bacterium]|nr:hypothetical protein [Actinomycetota bacterium]
MRRLTGVLAIATGLGLLLIPLAYSMFDRTADAERILDRFEFLTAGDNPQRYLDEAETTRAGSSELVGEALPGLAASAGVREGELEASFPALAAARKEVPQATEFSIRYSQQLDAVDDKFASVYDIPVSGLPLTATPWLFVLSGLACLAAGVLALRGSGAGSLFAILALGAAIVLGALGFGAIGKAADGEDVKDFASRGLTEQAATAAREASAALDAVVAETDQRTLSHLAVRQGVSEQELRRQLDAEHPAASELLAEWEGIGPRLSRLADAVSASVEEFESAKKLPIAFPVWLLLGAGLALSIAAGTALFRDRAGRGHQSGPVTQKT